MKIGGLGLCLLTAVALFVGCGGGGSETKPVPRTESKAVKASGAGAGAGDQARPPKCPSRSDPIAVTLDGEAGAENVGLLMAEKRGFFVDAGLMAGVAGPATPGRPVNYVATGVDAFGVTQQPQLVLAREEGVPIVAIGSVISQPTAAIIWLRESGISDIGDLEGKTVAVPGVPFQEDFLEAVLKRAGLSPGDVEVKRVNYRTVGALLHGRADAIFATWNIEGAALQAQGADPVIKRVQSLGLPRYEELVVIAREECARKHPEVMRRFMAAVARGTEAAREDRRAAANRIAEYHGFDPEFTMKRLRRQLNLTLPLLVADVRMDPARARQLTAWMHDEGMIEREPPARELFANGLLAKP